MHLYMGPGTYPLTRQQRARRMEGSKHLSHPFFFASVHSKLHKPLATGQCHAGPLSVTDFVSWVVAALPGARAMAFGNHRANSVRLGVHSPQSPSANVCLGKQCLSLSCTPQASRGPLSRKGAHIARVCVVACVPGSVVAAEGARKGRGTGVVARVEAAGAGDRARAVAGRHRYRCRWLRASRPPRKFGWAVPIVCNARRSMLCMIKTLMTADLGQGRRHHKGGNRGGPRCVRGARTRQVERAGLDDRGQAPAGAVVVGLTSLARAQCQRCRQQRQADRPHAASRPAAPHHAAAPPASLLSPRSGRVVTSSHFLSGCWSSSASKPPSQGRRLEPAMALPTAAFGGALATFHRRRRRWPGARAGGRLHQRWWALHAAGAAALAGRAGVGPRPRKSIDAPSAAPSEGSSYMQVY